MTTGYRDSHRSRAEAVRYEQEIYDRGSTDSWLWEVEKELLMDVVQHHLSLPVPRYLDFACGTGRVLAFLESAAKEAVGVDVSEAMLEIARDKVVAASLVVGDITARPNLLADRFDLVTAFRFFLNAEPALQTSALASLARVLRDNGVLIFNIHGNKWSLRFLSATWRRYILRQTRVNQVSVRTMKRRIEGAGLKVVEVHGYGLLPQRLGGRLSAARRNWLEKMVRRVPGLHRMSVNLMIVCRKR